MRSLRLLLASAALFAAAGPAGAADAAEPDPAQALFDRGVADLEAGRFDKACPAIEESLKLDPRPGTLFTLAECEAKRGRPATALRRYEEYLALYATLRADKKQKQGTREKESREARDALMTKVPELTLALPADAPRTTTVTLDGATVERARLGTPIRVEPGEHVVVAEAPGRRASTLRVTLQVQERKNLSLVIAPPDAPSETPPGPSGRRIGAFVSGGLGVAGLVLGAITGGLALGKKSTVEANCGASAGFPKDPSACNHTGAAAGGALKTLGAVSTVGFAVGGAGVVTGVVLFVTEPKATAVTVGWRRAW